MKKVLELYGVKCLSIDGSIPYKKRDDIVQKFLGNGSPRVLIFSTVGSTGLNLSIADVVIFFVRTIAVLDMSES
jgi:SNF2 family DNA or RNA helicase